jgi:DUF971 family protein
VELDATVAQLRADLERRDYVIQYKEAVWQQFDTEIRRHLKPDSALLRQIQATSNVLLSGRSDVRITNVVMINDQLSTDQESAMDIARKLLDSMARVG